MEKRGDKDNEEIVPREERGNWMIIGAEEAIVSESASVLCGEKRMIIGAEEVINDREREI